MSFEFFTTQMQRLNSQWKNSYGEERTKRLWLIWKKCEESLFAEIIDRALDTYRSAPLTEDFAKLEQEVRSQRAKYREYSGLDEVEGGGVLEKAFKACSFDNEKEREIVKGRLKNLYDCLDGKITKEQRIQGESFYDKAAMVKK